MSLDPDSADYLEPWGELEDDGWYMPVTWADFWESCE